MTNETEQDVAAQRIETARRWFTDGWTTDVDPDLTTSIEGLFAAGDRVVIRLVWRGTHTGSYGGVAAPGKPVEVRDTAIWCFQDGKVVQIETMQDQFALRKQVGYLPAGVYAA
jgi:predicted ester cyclase